MIDGWEGFPIPNNPALRRSGAATRLPASANKLVRGASFSQQLNATLPTPAVQAVDTAPMANNTAGQAAAIYGTQSVATFATSSLTDVVALTLGITTDGQPRSLRWRGNVQNPINIAGDIIVTLKCDGSAISGPTTFSGLINGSNRNFDVSLSHTPAAGPRLYTVEVHVSVGTITGLLQGMNLTIT